MPQVTSSNLYSRPQTWPSIELFLRVTEPEENQLEELAAMVGRLMDTLAERGALSNEDLESVLAGYPPCAVEVHDEP